MSYKSYIEQLQSHVEFLRDEGLDVSIDILCSCIGKGIFRCHEINVTTQRRDGNLAFRIDEQSMIDDDLVGISSWCRGRDGVENSHLSYGFRNDGSVKVAVSDSGASQVNAVQKRSNAARAAYGFWINSSTVGSSEYLIAKQVGAYGIRFRVTEEYGCAAVIPLRDRHGRIHNYQILNKPGIPVGKRFAPDAPLLELFHVIGKPVDGSMIGIAESYVTAATCYELAGICSVSAFSCENLVHVTRIFREMFPRSVIVLLADNDRHSAVNRGLLKAHNAVSTVENAHVIAPDFGDIPAAKDASDWNDLMIKMGREYAREQLLRKISASVPK